MRIEDDFIIRLVKQVVEFIEKLLRNESGADVEKANQAIENAYRRLLNMDRQLFELLDANNIVRMLGDPDRIEATVRVMQAEGDLLRVRGDHAAATSRYRRALNILRASSAISIADDLRRSLLERLQAPKDGVSDN